MSRSEIASQFPGYEIAPSIDASGWWKNQPYEGRAQAEARAQRLLDWTQAQFALTEERVAFVTHGDFILRLLSLIHDEPLTIPRNSCVTKVHVTPNSTRLTSYNGVDHLPEALITA